MIETREAIENLDSILDLEVIANFAKESLHLTTYIFVQGLDGAFLGPSDLSISLGVPTDLGLPKCQYTLARWHVLSRCFCVSFPQQ